MPAEDAIETTEQFREEIRGLFLTMSKDLSGMAKDMESLKSAVVGDPMTGTTGLLLRMTDTEKAADVLERHLEKEIQELKDIAKDEKARIDKKLAWINGVGALAAIIFAIVLALIEGGHFLGKG